MDAGCYMGAYAAMEDFYDFYGLAVVCVLEVFRLLGFTYILIYGKNTFLKKIVKNVVASPVFLLDSVLPGAHHRQEHPSGEVGDQEHPEGVRGNGQGGDGALLRLPEGLPPGLLLHQRLRRQDHTPALQLLRHRSPDSYPVWEKRDVNVFLRLGNIRGVLLLLLCPWHGAAGDWHAESPDGDRIRLLRPPLRQTASLRGQLCRGCQRGLWRGRGEAD